MGNKRDLARDLFIRRRLWADFEEVCKTPKACGDRMMPSSCEGCGWDSSQSFAEAQEAADRLEMREKESHEQQ